MIFFLPILNSNLFISAHRPTAKTRLLHSPPKWVSIKLRWRPMSFLSCLKDWRRSQSCWNSALCWMGLLSVQLCCLLSKQSTKWVAWRAMAWQVPTIPLAHLFYFRASCNNYNDLTLWCLPLTGAQTRFTFELPNHKLCFQSKVSPVDVSAMPPTASLTLPPVTMSGQYIIQEHEGHSDTAWAPEYSNYLQGNYLRCVAEVCLWCSSEILH